MPYSAEQRKVCQDHGIRIISLETFTQELRQAAVRCKQALQNKTYSSVRFLKNKSNSWAGALVHDILSEPQHDTIKGLQYENDMDVVFIDDAAYSGHQLTNIIDLTLNMGWWPKLTVHIVVPFVSEFAYEKLTNGFQGRVKDIKWYRSSMSLPEPVLNPSGVFPYSQRFAFEHKFPDGISVHWPDASVPRPEFAPPYRDNVDPN